MICFVLQACKNGRVQHLEHLLFYGADMNTQNCGGNTPLHVCAVENQVCGALLILLIHSFIVHLFSGVIK